MTADAVRNRALCCDCGALRTVGTKYRGRRPTDAPEVNDAARWTNWLKCAHCERVTLHAVLQDVNAANGILRNGCVMEHENRQTSAAARTIARRIGGLRAVGVEVEWVSDPHKADDGSDWPLAVWVETNGPIRYLRVELWDRAPLRCIIEAIENLEGRMDSPGASLDTVAGEVGKLLR